MTPSGETRNDSFSTPLRPPRSIALSPELMSPARRLSKPLIHHVAQRYPRFILYGSSAMTSICTRNPGSTKRCTCTQDVVGSRSLL